MKSDSIAILGVKINPVTTKQAVEIINGWLRKGGKHVVATTNIEFIMVAQKDEEFRRIINSADLSISDSSRIDWAYKITREKNLFKKILLWPFFLTPGLLKRSIPVATGVDLVMSLCKHFSKGTVTIGLLGGRKGVAEKAAECLKIKYPGLNISFAQDGGKVSINGGGAEEQVPKTDILLVAFGHIKQEKWIAKNKSKVNVRVFIGVGGTFDYLSGRIPRAPRLMRNMGFEWLYRLLIQPWRIKRFGNLVKFLFLTF